MVKIFFFSLKRKIFLMFCTMLGGGHSVKEKIAYSEASSQLSQKNFFCKFVSWKFIEKSSFFTCRHFLQIILPRKINFNQSTTLQKLSKCEVKAGLC